MTDHDPGGGLVRDPARRLVAEAGGTMVLLVAVVGSGIATSVDGAASTQLFQHAAVVGAVLAVLIWTLGPVSDAHFNPAVTLAVAITGAMSRPVRRAVLGIGLTTWLFRPTSDGSPVGMFAPAPSNQEPRHGHAGPRRSQPTPDDGHHPQPRVHGHLRR